jgi:anti-sigma regulatory factor (Ser/Thr protein kinase)
VAVRKAPQSRSHIFPSQVRSVRAARTWAATILAEWATALPDGDLVISELVTNAVIHGAGEISVRLAPRHNSVRIEVHDGGQGDVEHHHAELWEPGGRGIDIVSQLAQAWGWSREPGGQGTTVWAELAAGPASHLPGPDQRNQWQPPTALSL